MSNIFNKFSLLNKILYVLYCINIIDRKTDESGNITDITYVYRFYNPLLYIIFSGIFIYSVSYMIILTAIVTSDSAITHIIHEIKGKKTLSV